MSGECDKSCNNGWISVKDRPPKEEGRYLVFEKKETHSHQAIVFNFPVVCCKPNIAYFIAYERRWEWSSDNSGHCTPTHWQPLPEPPKD